MKKENIWFGPSDEINLLTVSAGQHGRGGKEEEESSISLETRQRTFLSPANNRPHPTRDKPSTRLNHAPSHSAGIKNSTFSPKLSPPTNQQLRHLLLPLASHPFATPPPPPTSEGKRER